MDDDELKILFCQRFSPFFSEGSGGLFPYFAHLGKARWLFLLALSWLFTLIWVNGLLLTALHWPIISRVWVGRGINGS